MLTSTSYIFSKRKMGALTGAAIMLLGLIFMTNPTSARSLKSRVKYFDKKISSIEKTVANPSAPDYRLRAANSSYKRLARKLDKARPDLKSHSRYAEFRRRMAALKPKMSELRHRARTLGLIRSYNFELPRWKKGKFKVYSPNGFIKELKRAKLNGVPGSYKMKVADGTFTLDQLSARVLKYSASNISTCVSKAHARLMKTGQAAGLVKRKGSPSFSNYYCSRAKSILWVYKVRRGGRTVRDIYRIHPRTGKILKYEPGR